MSRMIQIRHVPEEIHRRLTETDMGRSELRKYLEDEKITVRELGGWECAKCHY